MIIYQTKIKLHETDAAGVLFFSNQAKIIHDAYETLLERIGFAFADILKEKDFFVPIVHCTCDYNVPLFVGDLVEIQVTVAKVGKTSFTLSYKLLDASQNLVGSTQTVHVTVNRDTKKKIPLPQDLRTKLEDLFKEDHA